MELAGPLVRRSQLPPVIPDPECVGRREITVVVDQGRILLMQLIKEGGLVPESADRASRFVAECPDLGERVRVPVLRAGDRGSTVVPPRVGASEAFGDEPCVLSHQLLGLL